MKLIIYLLLALLGSGMLCACAQQNAQRIESNYVGQGFNVTECGPASAAMLVNFAGGQSSVYEARKLTKQQGLWTLDDIEQHLNHKGIPYQVEAGFSVAESLSEGGAVAVLMGGLIGHFVVAYELRGGMVRVADPLLGMRWESVQSFDARAVPLFIKVERKP